MKNWYLRTGIILIGAIMLIMIVSIFFTPYNPISTSKDHQLESPGIKHLLGTDKLGRDVLSRVMTGTRITFFVALGTVIIGIIFGTILGSFSGYYGGILDELIMRTNDAMLAFPGILFALILVSLFGRGILIIIVALGIIFIPSYIRVVRGEFVRCRNLEFVNSAKTMGAGPLRIMYIHILPNIIPHLIPSIVIGFSNAILAEASMSFLGLGVQPPNASWGSMISEAQSYFFLAPWTALAPGFMIIICVLGFNFIAEGLNRRIRKNA